ncbi:hypothetical protein N7520_004012 [Penicillium odoratum]|uniref:uncharacterized protein n=1 Tax=Penicillium odoratum TaxID=1167516 RepID=UPI0025486CDF|nr:uncharacterized protein N7520_004012 [Penicillium odoratum]KAJ5769453.1 hypothetical protein N7520_004012 [Penicillium odoratum]
MILSPRFHLLEIGDQSWCPEWMRVYIQSYLTRVWNLHLPPFSKTSPAGVAANLILEHLPDASFFTFVDLCAGAGGPTGTLEKILNSKLLAEGKQTAQFVLTDLHPCLEEWSAISKRQEKFSYISEPQDATQCERIAGDGKECRIFNLCFHHFDDPAASTTLRKAAESADSFIIFEFAQRNFTSLLNIPVMLLFPLWYTIARYRNSPLHLFFTYVIPLLPLLLAFDGLVSTMRCRTGEEIEGLLRQEDLDLTGWTLKSGNRILYKPFVHVYYFIGVKNE